MVSTFICSRNVVFSCQSSSIPTYGTESFRATSNFLFGGYKISDNIQLPFVHLQLPHITSNLLMVAIVIMVAMVAMVVIRPVHKYLFLEFPKMPGSFMLHFDR